MTTPPLPATTTQLYIALRSYLNASGPTQQALLNFSSSDAFTANAGSTQYVTVPANTVGQEINLTTLFPAFALPLFVSIADVSQPAVGFSFYSDSGSPNKQTVAPGCWAAWMPNGATPLSPIYVDNPSAINVLVLCISCASN